MSDQEYFLQSQQPESDQQLQEHKRQLAHGLLGQSVSADLQLSEQQVHHLFAPLPHGQGQTILREALLVADHNAYHLGQLVVVRRLLGAWPEDA